MSSSAFEGIKVIEFATMVSGPYCAKLLGDLGADVIKVEPPEGDPARGVGPFANGQANPEQSAMFLYNNTSKQGVTLDLENPDDLESFKGLLASADVLIDNYAPGTLDKRGLGWKALHELNPRLVYTQITPYGAVGPRANVKGDELTVVHAGGLGNLLPTRATDIDRAPIKMGGYVVAHHGSVAGALATAAALYGRASSGLGAHVDISLQEVIMAMMAPVVAGTRYHKTTWRRVPDRPPAMGRMQTKDGYVVLNALDDHHFKAVREMMGNPEWCASDDWLSLEYRAHHLMEIGHLLDEWMLGQKKNEIHHRAAKMKIPIGPINTAEDVMNNPQYAARKYFVEVDHPEAGAHRYAGWPYKMTGSPARVSRPAPLLGQHNAEALKGLKPQVAVGHNPVPNSPPSNGNGRLPLEGVRILELCWVWAGPYANMLLAHLGAEVIKVEGHNRTDIMRRNVVWPLPERAPTPVPPNQGLAFNSVNLNKKGATIDLTKPRGIELVNQLVAKSDIVVDNMRPGALTKLGLGHDDLRKIRPDIIVASSSGRGYEGPESNYVGYASIHHGIGGGAYITGYPDDHPCHSLGDVDIMNATTLAFSLVAALHHRRRTGEGQSIDYSQCEGVSSLLGEVLLGYEMTKEIPERMGNAHPTHAPHNLYGAWGVDRWVAIEVHTDEEFAALAKAIGRPELAGDARFADRAARKKNEAELDEIIGAWIRGRDRDWVVSELNQAGVAAAPSADGSDLYADPHLRARGAFLTVDHPEIGEIELVGPPWKMDRFETPTRHAPLLGEHNEYVFKEILGLNDGDLAALRKDDVIM